MIGHHCLHRFRLLSGALLAIACSSGSDISGTKSGSGTVQLSFRLLTLDAGTGEDVSVRARVADITVDSTVVVLADGRSAQLTVPANAPLDLTIATTSGNYYSSAARETVAHDSTIDVVLIPTTWTIRQGVYQSTRVRIDLASANATNPDGSHFLNFASASPRMLTSWTPEALPIAVGFDTTGVAQWTSSDSTVFWQVAASLDTVFGQRLFRPANRGGFAPANAIGVQTEAVGLQYMGLLGTNYDACRLPRRLCSSVQGEIAFPPGFYYVGPGLFTQSHDEERRRGIAHELMHALGFGHTCAWSSVVLITQLTCLALPEVPTRPTAEDVAYVEMILTLAGVMEAHPYAWQLAEASRAATVDLNIRPSMPRSAE